MIADDIQIAAWKKEHKYVIKISTEGADEQYAYFKQPTLEIVKAYKKLNKNDIFAAMQYLFEACKLDDNKYEDEFVLSAARSLIEQSTSEKDERIDSTPGADEIKKSAAIVRHYFNVDPYQLPINEFYKLLSEALWLQGHNAKQLEQQLTNTLANVFSNNQY